MGGTDASVAKDQPCPSIIEEEGVLMLEDRCVAAVVPFPWPVKRDRLRMSNRPVEFQFQRARLLIDQLIVDQRFKPRTDMDRLGGLGVSGSQGDK